MAVYPQNIPWHKSTTLTRRQGISAVEMSDGSVHTQTFYSSVQIRFRVRHRTVTDSELDSIMTFLTANAGLDIDIVEPATGDVYRGKQLSEVATPYDGDVHFNVSWEFQGVKL